MVEVIVALIAMLGTVTAATLPKLLEKRYAANSQPAPAPASLTLIFILAIFVIVGVWSSYNRAAELFSSSPEQLSFFLGVAGISSALFGNCSVSHRQNLGMYVGYTSATTAALFLLWSILIKMPEDMYILWYAWATTIALGLSLKLYWRKRSFKDRSTSETNHP